MQKFFLFILCVINIFPLKANPSSSEIGIVYYDDFRIERVAPLTEDMAWEEIACKYEIHKEDFLGLLSRIDNALSEVEDGFFCYGNIRAKVIFPESGVYFVDRNRHNSKYGFVRYKKTMFFTV
ncbi:MAG: hypothetical protein LBF61_08055 [Azoarcus sp.]|jgi:hypothetical protein|nr:hypothetical protein [Azoarcus sp.]